MQFNTTEERSEFILNNLGLVWLCIKKHLNKNNHGNMLDNYIDDLEQEGKLGLIMAVDRFDPDKQIKFSTYAMPYIDGYIKTFKNFNTTIKPGRTPEGFKYIPVHSLYHQYDNGKEFFLAYEFIEDENACVEQVLDKILEDEFFASLSVDHAMLARLLCTEENLTHKQIANELGVTRTCISRRILRMRKKLIDAGFKDWCKDNL